MKKVSYYTTMPYSFDPSKRTTKFYYNDRWHNCGEWLEAVLKYQRGYTDFYRKDSTPYYKGSDLQAEKASVKSSRATLAKIFGDDFDEIVTEYFSRVKSEQWYFVTYSQRYITEWHMDKQEFTEFIYRFGRLEYSQRYKKNLLRISTVTFEMEKWLRNRAR